jgi:hypothetical protein
MKGGPPRPIAGSTVLPARSGDRYLLRVGVDERVSLGWKVKHFDEHLGSGHGFGPAGPARRMSDDAPGGQITALTACRATPGSAPSGTAWQTRPSFALAATAVLDPICAWIPEQRDVGKKKDPGSNKETARKRHKAACGLAVVIR